MYLYILDEEIAVRANVCSVKVATGVGWVEMLVGRSLNVHYILVPQIPTRKYLLNKQMIEFKLFEDDVIIY